MRIGFDARLLTDHEPHAGIAMYVYQLLKELPKAVGGQHTIAAFGHLPQAPVGIHGVEWVKVPDTWRFKAKVVGEQVVFPQWLHSQKLDVYHGPANQLPLGYRGKTVVTAHDFAIYKHPEFFLGGQWWSTSVVVPRSMRKADRVIAVSKQTAQDAVELMSVRQDRLRVIYEGVTVPKIPASTSPLRVPYFLFVGTLEPRKNLVRLLRAFRQRVEEGSAYDLVLIGKRGWKVENIRDAVRQFPYPKRLHVTGKVTEEEKWMYMQHASGFVYPSVYEGFGLPPLEAAALGIPVIASSTPTLQEVFGEAALTPDPLRSEEIAEAMEKVEKDSDLRNRLSVQGTALATRLTWERCAQETASLYQEIV